MTESQTLQRIHEQAVEEFLEKGFRGASLREIVKKLGVTTGAFYGYYKSKESLFDALVEPHARKLAEIYATKLNEFNALPQEQQIAMMSAFSKAGILDMYAYAKDHRDAFRLILLASEGTRWENYIHDLVKKEFEATHQFYEMIQQEGQRALNPTLSHILVSGMFSSFFELIIHEIPEEEGLRCVEELYAFYMAGWRRLFHLPGDQV